ncbi:MAG: TMEM175 family protein [Haloarculaceae archaeon]
MRGPYQREREESARVLALSDGVIAIVITLLVLEITVPTLPPGAPATAVPQLVFEQWPDFLGFALSFLVVGLYWVLHRRTFLYIETYERGVVWLNLCFLLFVALVPYATSVFTTYPSGLGVAVLSVALAATGFSLALVWVYASRRDLLAAGLASRSVEIQAARYLASPIVFVLSALLAVVDPTLALLAWFLLVPINAVLQSRLVESVEAAAADPADRDEEALEASSDEGSPRSPKGPGSGE